VEVLAPSEKEENIAHRVEARNAGAPTTLGSFAPTNQKNRMMVINLYRLASYQGAAGAVGG
jgi:hypothetical protein